MNMADICLGLIVKLVTAGERNCHSKANSINT